LSRTIDFEGRTTDFVYDDLGRLDEKLYFAPGVNPDAAQPNEITDYVYDDLGRQKQVIQDLDGNLNTTADQRVTDNFFDDFGRLDRVTTPEGTINYDYFDDTGQLERTYTGANLATARTETAYTYDRIGRLETVTAVKQNSTTINDVTTYEYDAVGNLAFVIVAADAVGSMVSQYTYDDLNRLDLLEHYYDENNNQQFDGIDRRLATFDYEVRTDGRRTGVIEQTYNAAGTLTQTNTIAWVYDGLNRLVEERFDGQGIDDHDFIDVYTYDLMGNRKKKEHDANPGFSGVSTPSDLLGTTPSFTNGADDETVDYNYDANDRLITEFTTDQSGTQKLTAVYVYGGTGNPSTKLTKKIEVDFDTNVTKTTDSTYNLQGRLAKVEIDDTSDGTFETTIDYEYNDSGIRVSQTKDGIKTRYLVDGNNHTGYAQVLEAWEDLNSNGIRDAGELTSYVLGHDVIAQFRAASAAMEYLLYDGHGSTRGLVDAMGLPLTGQIYAYDAYGNQLTGAGLTSASAALTTLLYSGEFSDLATGLQYLRARFYNPQTGRFNRVDDFAGNISDPQSLHKYLYTHADPVNGVDPSGEIYRAIFAALTAALSSPAAPIVIGGAVILVGGYFAFDYLAYHFALVNAPVATVVQTRQINSGLKVLQARLAENGRGTDPKLQKLISLMNSPGQGGLTIKVTDLAKEAAGSHFTLAPGVLYISSDVFNLANNVHIAAALVTYAEFQHDRRFAPNHFPSDNDGAILVEFDKLRQFLRPGEANLYIRTLRHPVPSTSSGPGWLEQLAAQWWW